MLEKPRLSLTLSVKAKNWRQSDHASEDADQEFAKVRMRALQRDNFTCVACGFRSIKYQEVHHKDDDHHNNDLNNLATVCSFCHNCQHIGFAGINKEATLIWAPEFSQADINHLARTWLVAEQWFKMTKDDVQSEIQKVRAARHLSEAGESIKNALLERQGEAQTRLGTHDPTELADALLQLDDLVYDKRDLYLDGIRLLPLGKRTVNGEDQMKKMVMSWLENGGPYFGLRPPTWNSLIDTLLG